MTDSVGIVKTKCFTFANPPDEMMLKCGKKLGPVTLAYETYGALSPEKDNAILIFHALTGDSHAAGYHSEKDSKPGWWDTMVGPGKAFDTNKYFIICSNYLGGCKGTTGPDDINPKTKKKYGLSFPVVTITDMVKVQKKLIDHLKIKKLLAVAGGSMGGMLTLEWLISYPDSTRSAIAIATTSRLSPQAIAFDHVGRNAIISDQNWHNGTYDLDSIPKEGLAIARMIGHITYLSDASMHKKFGRRLQSRDSFGYDISSEFQVENYLKYQGDKFVERFDANTYLYLTKAMDYFDLPSRYGSLTQAFKNISAKTLVISFTSDWLFPPYQSKEIVKAMMNLDKDVSYIEIKSSYGHDAFLLETNHLTKIVKSFLTNLKLNDGK
ncbi:homoserine O-acetyltransferase [bacterium]|nr:homoserine O-acetyltransferase [bacterium]